MKALNALTYANDVFAFCYACSAGVRPSRLRLSFDVITVKQQYECMYVKMDDSNVYRQYLIKRYWERKNENELRRIIPYEDYYINLEEPPYTDSNESKTHVNESAVERFVDRILTNQTISLADGKDYYDDFESSPLGNEESKIPRMYKTQSNSFSDYRLPKRRTGNKNARRSRCRKPSDDDERFMDLPEGSEVSYIDSVPMVTLSIEMLRRYMYVEVEARVRYINEYYAKQWDDVNKEKMACYAEMILIKEKNEILNSELREMENMLSKYKQICGQLEDKVEVSKEARRRRRQARKQRKSDKPFVSHSDTVSCIHKYENEQTTETETLKDSRHETGNEAKGDENLIKTLHLGTADIENCADDEEQIEKEVENESAK
ncbi:uncharacterized protein LOC123560455 [Mercenaria mercenaria]|uniref:uncharacterized protein LOC123560455 n=1 Tax=Mercenaria mercenaria TaxID=6596 RepID=UPI00234EE51A|nr:uncharacterized protein LOC123560455 [Mercenaria mercenaria]